MEATQDQQASGAPGPENYSHFAATVRAEMLVGRISDLLALSREGLTLIKLRANASSTTRDQLDELRTFAIHIANLIRELRGELGETDEWLRPKPAEDEERKSVGDQIS